MRDTLLPGTELGAHTAQSTDQRKGYRNYSTRVQHDVSYNEWSRYHSSYRIMSYRIIHSNPEMKVLLHTINIPTPCVIYASEIYAISAKLSVDSFTSLGCRFSKGRFTFLRSTHRSTTTKKSKERREGVDRNIVYSRRPGNRNDVIAKNANPSSTQPQPARL